VYTINDRLEGEWSPSRLFRKHTDHTSWRDELIISEGVSFGADLLGRQVWAESDSDLVEVVRGIAAATYGTLKNLHEKRKRRAGKLDRRAAIEVEKV